MLAGQMPPTLAIVGAGRLGRALGRLLRDRGWRIGAVVTRSAATARTAVRAIGDGTPCAKPTRRVLAAEILLITTPDAAIRPVADELASMGREEWRGKVVLHTSGALDHHELAALERWGAATGSLHPMQTFSPKVKPHLEGVLFAIEGHSAALRVARRIARELGGVPVRLRAGAKPAYHAAGALASGHVLGIVEAAVRILMSQGFTRRQATQALLPLTRQTLENYVHLGPAAAWTGPVSRGDYSTVAKHLEALGKHPKEYGAAYTAVTRLSAAVLSGDAGDTLRQLERILKKHAYRGEK